MKNVLRKTIGYSTAVPFYLMIKTVSLFAGRERAVEIVGPFATSLARFSLIFLLPGIKDPAEYGDFKAGMKKKFKFWKPLFDFEIAHEDEDTIELKIDNCPFCESIRQMGISELCPYVCQGDWEFAKDNSEKWTFERSHQIGTGDSYCNHTYKRK